MTELRKRLSKAGAEIHVVKNSIFRSRPRKPASPISNGADRTDRRRHGQKDVSAAAKVVKNFCSAEFDKLKIKFGT